MKNLNQTLDQALLEINQVTPEAWEHKPAPHKWSKKEILGHLVDSARNNLQRFTEIQYFESPYQVIDYDQDQLVIANQYQNEPLASIRALWESLNRHIAYVMEHQNAASLAQTVILPDGSEADLKWLMEDYIQHLLHHKAQILSSCN